MNYMVIVRENKIAEYAVAQVEKEVNEYMKMGWEPQGGLSVSRSETHGIETTIVAQAIIKK